MAKHLSAAPIASSAPVGPVGGMLVWFKADAITGLSDNSGLATWLDSSGNGNTASQATGALQPTYYTTTHSLNGLPVVWWTDATRYMTTSTLSTSPLSTGTVFAVAAFNSSLGSYQYLMDGGDSTHRWAMGTGIDNVGNMALGAGSTIEYPFLDGGSHVWTYLVNGASSAIRLDGWTIVTGNTGSDQLEAITLGNNYEPVINNGAGPYLAELILYNGILTNAQIQQNETYLNHKWSLG